MVDSFQYRSISSMRTVWTLDLSVPSVIAAPLLLPPKPDIISASITEVWLFPWDVLYVVHVQRVYIH